MTERATSNKVVLEMVRGLKETTEQFQGDLTDIKVSLAEIKNEIKNMPIVDQEKHKALEQQMNYQDEKIEKVQKEVKDLKATIWGIVASILLMFINTVWGMITK